jgi:hypothetical protein
VVKSGLFLELQIQPVSVVLGRGVLWLSAMCEFLCARHVQIPRDGFIRIAHDRFQKARRQRTDSEASFELFAAQSSNEESRDKSTARIIPQTDK